MFLSAKVFQVRILREQRRLRELQTALVSGHGLPEHVILFLNSLREFSDFTIEGTSFLHGAEERLVLVLCHPRTRYSVTEMVFTRHWEEDVRYS